MLGLFVRFRARTAAPFLRPVSAKQSQSGRCWVAPRKTAGCLGCRPARDQVFAQAARGRAARNRGSALRRKGASAISGTNDYSIVEDQRAVLRSEDALCPVPNLRNKTNRVTERYLLKCEISRLTSRGRILFLVTGRVWLNLGAENSCDRKAGDEKSRRSFHDIGFVAD